MKLPPYAKPLYDLHVNNVLPTNSVWVFLGRKAWDKGKGFSVSHTDHIAILPPWHSAFSYYWPVRDCDILIVDTGFSDSDYLDEVALCLYEFNAKIVRLINLDNELIIYHKEVEK